MGTALGASERTHTAARRRIRLTRPGAVIVLAAVLLLAFYAWTASSSSNPFNKVSPFGFTYGDSDYYNLQADAYLHGHLWLDVPIDRRITEAENPYSVNVKTTLEALPDGSYYKGRYYLSWGPAPAVTTFLPPRLVGLQVRENLVVVLYCFLGVLLAAATLRLLLRHLVPDAPRAVLWTGTSGLALASSIPWILRRATVYEVAITGAFFFTMAGLLVLVRELLRDSAPRRSRLAWTGALLGLAVLSRPTAGFAAVGMAGLAYVLRPEARRRTIALVVGIPVLAGGVFMIYNAVRFSGPLDFGNKWQTSGRDVRDVPFGALANLPPALYAYLIAPVRWTLDFPYLHIPPPPKAPFHVADGYGQEETGSMVWAVPFVLLSGAFLAGRRWRARTAPGDAATARLVARVVLALVAGAVLVWGAVAFSVPGYTERYELDFLPSLIMAATIGWAALATAAPTRRRAAWWRRAGIVLAAWSALVGVAISITGYYDSLRLYHLSAFQALEGVFSPLPTVATMVAGRPMISALSGPEDLTGNVATYTKVDVDGATLALHTGDGSKARATIVSPGARDAELDFQASTPIEGTFALTAETGGVTTAVLVQDRSSEPLPLRLKRGVNHVSLALAPGPDVVPPPPGYGLRVALRDVRVR